MKPSTMLRLFSFFLLLLMSGLAGSSISYAVASTSDSSNSWTLELTNAVGDQATVNSMWCASPTGDLSFGPVQGADTSSPDASIWAVTQSPQQFVLHLRLPSTIDYSCRLATRLQTQPSSLWSFSLPLSILNQDNYTSGDIKCNGPWHWAGVNPLDIPPGCDLFDADGFGLASVRLSPLTTATTTPASSSTTAPAPAPFPSSESEEDDTRTSKASAPSPSSLPSTAHSPIPDSSDSKQHDGGYSKQPPTVTAPSSPVPARAPPRKLLC